MTERTKYSPTVNAGDERVRVRYIGIRTECGQNPTVEILEEVVVRRADGTEKKIEDLPGLSFQIDAKAIAQGNAEALADYLAPVIRRAYSDDHELPGETSKAQSVDDFYSVIRSEQLKRDAKQAAALAAQQGTP